MFTPLAIVICLVLGFVAGWYGRLAVGKLRARLIIRAARGRTDTYKRRRGIDQ